MNLKIISAGAGSGKTYSLTQEMVKLLSPDEEGRVAVRASGIIATTFTNKAAAELKERVRIELLESGLTKEADELGNAMIGTVHSIGVQLLKRFAFEAGVSPEVDIIADSDQQSIFNQSLSSVLSIDLIQEMEQLSDQLGFGKNAYRKRDWRADLKAMTDIARANNFDVDVLEESKKYSLDSFFELLPASSQKDAGFFDAELQKHIQNTLLALENNDDGTKGKQSLVGTLRGYQNSLNNKGYICWHEWAALSKIKATKKSRDDVFDLIEFAKSHNSHPAFHLQICSYVTNIFNAAIAAIKEYEQYKKVRGLIDYIDMEVLILKLLEQDVVKEVLSEEIDLLLVDEFQDTNPLQLKIFLNLTNIANKSIWVGDPKQSIYGFRGAAPELMKAVMDSTDNISNLPHSWRSREDLVHFCNGLFVNAFDGEMPVERIALDTAAPFVKSKESTLLKPTTHHWHFQFEGRPPRKPWFEQCIARTVSQVLSEDWMVRIKGSNEVRKMQAGDIAILCRSNYSCQDVAEALHKEGVKASISRNGLLETAESKLILAGLRYILNKHDALAVAELLILANKHQIEDVITSRLEYLENIRGVHDNLHRWGNEVPYVQQLNSIRQKSKELSASEIDNLVEKLKALEFVEFASKEPIYKTSFVPNDSYHSGSDKWFHTLVGSESAWNISLGRSGVKVAIVDNAVFSTHSDLTTFKQYDVADNDNNAAPPQTYTQDAGWSHGTHCAGLATADINNSTGIASLGGNVELIAIKATPDNAPNSSSIWYGYSGVQWACQNGADVVSMSYGGSNSNPAMQTLINAYPDVVFLAAAGNDGNTIVQYPAGYTNVIGVGSVNSNDNRSGFSNYNGGTTFVDIASPGGYSNGGLLSTVYTSSGNSYAKMGGTSMAAPFAAGLVGLMLSVNPTLTPAQILSCLTSTGVVINQSMGTRIDAYAAMQCVQATLTGDPIPDFFAIPTSITEGETVQFYDNSADGGNSITNWQWTFSSGSPGTYTGQTPPVVSYATAGAYTVTLQVTNSQDSVLETKSSYINVGLQPYGAWIKQNSGFSTASRGINYISIADANTVWATGYDGTGGGANVQEFTKTTDGGLNWTTGNINVGNSGLGISMIHAIDANTAWLAAYPTAGGQTGGVWKTANGGTTWTRQSTATFNNAASFTNVVYFWDANNGFCQGDPINGEFELYTTTNGGTTWSLVSGANIPNPLNGNEFGYTRQIEVIGDNVWFTTSVGRIYHSTDKGLTWTVYTSPVADFGGAITTGTSANMSFSSSTTGLIIDNNATVYATTNSGSTWNTVTTTGTVLTNGLCYIEGTAIAFTTGAAAGSSGSSYSIDGGTNWNIIDTEQHLYIEFINQSVGWSGWFNADASTDGMWKWNDMSSPLSPDFSGSPFNVCVADTVTFTDLTTGGTPTSWLWSFPGGNPTSSTLPSPTVTYSSSGIHPVSLTVSDGTFQSTYTDTAHIISVDPASAPSAISGNTTPCPFTIETYTVTNDPDVFYTWTLSSGWTGTSSSNSINITVNDTSGIFSVTADNVCGSSAAINLVLNIIDSVQADFTYADNGSSVDFTSTSINASGWTWDFGDSNSSNAENPTHVYSSGGNFTVVLIATNACGFTDTTSQQITITLTSTEQMLNENSQVQVYPNPASDILLVDGLTDNVLGERLEVVDVLGRTVIRLTATGKKQSIDISTLANGVYSLSFSRENKTCKFIKTN